MTDGWSHWSEQESWSRDRLAAHQQDVLNRQLGYLWHQSRFYRRRLEAAGWAPGTTTTTAALAELPFTTKADYRSSLDEDQPWGSMLAAPETQVRRVHFSSGTTAVPTPLYWTGPDLDRWADLYARAAYGQGVRPGDIYQCLFSFSWFCGGLGALAGYERLGCTCIPGGSVDTERQLATIVRHGTTVVGGTPSFLLHLAEAAEAAGVDLPGSSVRVVMTGGEPGAGIPGIRDVIEERWGARAYDGYGSIEFQPIAWECDRQAGGHLFEDFALAEVVDPATGDAVPDGEEGVLVLTHLDKQAVPLLRWWTGDVVVRSIDPCACGRTSARIVGGVRGRADDMLIVRGVNVFPSALEDLLRRAPGVTGEFRIVVDPALCNAVTGLPDAVRLDVEISGDQRTAEGLQDLIRRELRIRALVRPLAPGSLPRFTQKASRLVRPGN